MSGLKDKDNVLRTLDEADNMIAIVIELAKKQSIDTNEACRRLIEVRRKLKFVGDRAAVS